ncbi:unnamed protein product, partial [Brassica oleracea]
GGVSHASRRDRRDLVLWFFGVGFLSEAGVLGPRDTFVGGFFNGTRRRSLGWLERPSLAMSPEIEADSHGVHPKDSSSFPQPFIPLVLRLDSTFCFIACNLDSAISPGNSHVRVVTFSECP